MPVLNKPGNRPFIFFHGSREDAEDFLQDLMNGNADIVVLPPSAEGGEE